MARSSWSTTTRAGFCTPPTRRRVSRTSSRPSGSAGRAVELVHYNKGRFLHAADEKASLENEQSSVGVRGPRGRVLVRQIAGLIARRIVTDAKPGDRVKQGERLGLIRFGSRTDVFLPLSARPVVKVKPGDRVLVGGTVLAEYA